MMLKDYIKTGMATAFLAISVYAIPPVMLPFSQVPFTLQTMVIVLIAFMFKPYQAFLAIILYLILGSIGLPIFAYGQGGFDRIIGPTGGFLLLFPLVAYGISFFKSKDKHIRNIMTALLWSILVLYPLATIWLAYSLSLDYLKALYIMLPFIPLDILKTFLAYAIYKRLPEDLI